MKSAPELITKVKQHEAFREYAYPDPASPLARVSRERGYKTLWGFEPAVKIIKSLPEDISKLHGNPWTCGYGETKDVTYETRWSKDEAHRRLMARLLEFENGVLALCTREPNPNECAALTSFCYNVGLGNLKKSSVLKAHNRGDKQAAARAFGLWNKAGKPPQPMEGLTRRRAEESSLYLKPHQDIVDDEVELAEYTEPVSQQVEPERPMTQSTINKASAVAGGTAAIAAATEVVETVNSFKAGVDGLGDWLVPILLIVTLCAVGYAVHQRLKQREGGWA
jgi:lysozyme